MILSDLVGHFPVIDPFQIQFRMQHLTVICVDENDSFIYR